MNCFMGYNPLATKQVKVTVWVCEQDGASPVAPSNPSAGDCFIVYATDEAVLSNTPTSAKTYTNGEWADAEGGGGGGGDFSIAEVTFVDCNTTSGSAYYVKCSTVEDEVNAIVCDEVSVNNDAPTKVYVPLYKNSFYLNAQLFSNLDYSVMPTTDGDIEFDSEKFVFHIYGNGTITLKGDSSL